MHAFVVAASTNSEPVWLEDWGIPPGRADCSGAIQHTDTVLQFLALTPRRPPFDGPRCLLKTFGPVVLFPYVGSPQEEHQALRLPMP